MKYRYFYKEIEEETEIDVIDASGEKAKDENGKEIKHIHKVKKKEYHEFDSFMVMQAAFQISCASGELKGLQVSVSVEKSADGKHWDELGRWRANCNPVLPKIKGEG